MHLLRLSVLKRGIPVLHVENVLQVQKQASKSSANSGINAKKYLQSVTDLNHCRINTYCLAAGSFFFFFQSTAFDSHPVL